MLFNDFEKAYPLFTALEALADGWGGWKIVDVLGCSWVDLDEAMAEDILTCKRIAGIVNYQNKSKDSGEGIENARI